MADVRPAIVPAVQQPVPKDTELTIDVINDGKVPDSYLMSSLLPALYITTK
jgi:hypothetical protein